MVRQAGRARGCCRRRRSTRPLPAPHLIQLVRGRGADGHDGALAAPLLLAHARKGVGGDGTCAGRRLHQQHVCLRAHAQHAHGVAALLPRVQPGVPPLVALFELPQHHPRRVLRQLRPAHGKVGPHEQGEAWAAAAAAR